MSRGDRKLDSTYKEDQEHADAIMHQLGWRNNYKSVLYKKAAHNERAWAKIDANTSQPRFYFDLRRHQKSAESGQTPWTPAVSIWFQLDKSLAMMFEEGMDNVYARHHRLATATRNGVKAMGLQLLATEGIESDTVTAIRLPEGIDGGKLLQDFFAAYETVRARPDVNGKVGAGMAIFQLPEANALDVARRVEGKMDQLAKALPPAEYPAQDLTVEARARETR